MADKTSQEPSLLMFQGMINMADALKEAEREKNYYQQLYAFTNVISEKHTISAILGALSDMLHHFLNIKKLDIYVASQLDIENDATVHPIDTSQMLQLQTKLYAFLSGELLIEGKEPYYIQLPLKGHQAIYGVVRFTVDGLERLDKSATDFLTEVGIASGKAIEKQSLYNQSSQTVESLTLVQEAMTLLHDDHSLEDMTHLIDQKIRSICKGCHLGMLIRHNEKEHLYIDDAAFLASRGGVVFREFLFQETSAYSEPYFSGNFHSEEFHIPFTSLMVFPIKQDQKVNGHLFLLHENAYYFSFDNFKVVKAFILHFSMAMKNMLLRAELKQAATMDYLTGLYVRKHLEKTVWEHLRDGTGGSLILMDIDDFKKINDTYGHDIGDTVLKQVADILHNHKAEKLLAARWGGEELALYGQEMDIREAERLAGQIAGEISIGTSPAVTVSCGISSWQAGEEVELASLFKAADKALYRAKKNGKNQVMVQ